MEEENFFSRIELASFSHSPIKDKILIVVSSIKREEILQFLKNYNTDCIFDIRDTINLIDIRVDPVRR